jgi:hypothetical protein
MSNKSKINYLIVLDSLNIGGKERLALDQAYFLHSNGCNVKIIILNHSTENNLAMLNMDHEFSEVPPIEVLFVSGSRLGQFFQLIRLFTNFYRKFVVLTHSTRALVLTRIASFILPNTIVIHTMNQSLALSDNKQAFKIAFYSLFANHLLAGCQPFIDEWKRYVHSSTVKKLIFSKKRITLNRNGLYIPRLLNAKNSTEYSTKNGRKILYLGRVVEWKGTKIYGQISNNVNKKNIESIIAIPAVLTESQQLRFGVVDTPMKQIVGKPPTQIPNLHEIVHIYPADYGDNSNFYESISLNVMELLCLGVPSIISVNGRSTWPELLNYSMLIDCDWSSLDEIQTSLEKLFSLSENQKLQGKALARKIFSIENNLEGIFRIVKYNW